MIDRVKGKNGCKGLKRQKDVSNFGSVSSCWVKSGKARVNTGESSNHFIMLLKVLRNGVNVRHFMLLTKMLMYLTISFVCLINTSLAGNRNNVGMCT